VLAEAAAAGPPQALWIAVVGGLLSLASAVVVAWFSFRGNARNTDNDRDRRYDERVDKENERLRLENETLRTQAYQAREEIVRLRLKLRTNGVNPDREDTDA
jgi:cell division protein FtsL